MKEKVERKKKVYVTPELYETMVGMIKAKRDTREIMYETGVSDHSFNAWIEMATWRARKDMDAEEESKQLRGQIQGMVDNVKDANSFRKHFEDENTKLVEQNRKLQITVDVLKELLKG